MYVWRHEQWRLVMAMSGDDNEHDHDHDDADADDHYYGAWLFLGRDA